MEIHTANKITMFSPQEEPSISDDNINTTDSQKIPKTLKTDDKFVSNKASNSVITPNSADMVSIADSESLKGVNNKTENFKTNTKIDQTGSLYKDDKNNNNNNNNNNSNNENSSSLPDDVVESRKINIDQIDEEVSKILSQLDQIENNFKHNLTDTKTDEINHKKIKTNDDPKTIKEIRNLIDNFKSTVLRLNLKNTLVKNQLLTVKDDYLMERYLLINKIEDLENTLRIIQDENNAVNSRNIKLIKYIRTLKNEKIKMYMIENKRLKDHIERLEEDSYNGLNAIRINHPQRYTSIPSPLNASNSTLPPSLNLQYSNSNTDTSNNNINGSNFMRHTISDSNSNSNHIEDDYGSYHIRQQIYSPTNFNMLDTLGRLATEYLHNEYPDDDTNENHIDHA